MCLPASLCLHATNESQLRTSTQAVSANSVTLDVQFSIYYIDQCFPICSKTLLSSFSSFIILSWCLCLFGQWAVSAKADRLDYRSLIAAAEGLDFLLLIWGRSRWRLFHCWLLMAHSWVCPASLILCSHQHSPHSFHYWIFRMNLCTSYSCFTP